MYQNKILIPYFSKFARGKELPRKYAGPSNWDGCQIIIPKQDNSSNSFNFR